MGDWKARAPAALALPSSSDVAEHTNSDGGQKGARSVGSSPFPAGGGVQSFPIVVPESLLTPADPGFLDGASSLARFGLDVGGTLCKVVYFEPEVKSGDEGSGGARQNSKTVNDGDGVEKGKRGEDGVKTGETGDGSGVNGSRQPRSGWPADAPKKSNGYVGIGVDREGLTVRDNGNGRASESAPESAQYSDEKAAEGGLEEYKNERNPGGGGAGEDDLDSHRQVKKIWVSSHEPVHLPGRGTLYFKCFETWQMQEFLNLTKVYNLMTRGRAIGATGGGAKKFGDQFEIAGLQLQRADELKSLVRGIDFLARHAQQESFEYLTGAYEGGSIQRPWQSPENSDDGSDVSSEEDFSLIPGRKESESGASSSSASREAPPERGQDQSTQKASTPTLKGRVLAKLGSGCWMGSKEPLQPYLVVNIGSGVSMLLVHSPDKFERVGGTSLGGSTFLGLANALTGCQSFEEALSLAMQGDSTHVDMLVGDIYGGDYTEMGLAATTVASSFGKLVLPKRSAESHSPQHLAKAALLMVTNNIGSIAMLHARNANVNSIMFTGSFLHNNKLAMRLLAVALEFWSKGKMKALFLRHEGHAGAMGALLSTLEASNPLDALLLT